MKTPEPVCVNIAYAEGHSIIECSVCGPVGVTCAPSNVAATLHLTTEHGSEIVERVQENQ